MKANGFQFRLIVFLSALLLAGSAGAASVTIEDFENDLVLYPASKTGWESNAAPGSSAAISRSGNAKIGKSGGELKFDVRSGGWALVQKKIEGAEWLSRGPKAISFWVKGEGAGELEVELEESYSFKWRKKIPLVDKEWHQVRIPLSEFTSTEKTQQMSVANLNTIKFVYMGGKQTVLIDEITVETD